MTVCQWHNLTVIRRRNKLTGLNGLSYPYSYYIIGTGQPICYPTVLPATTRAHVLPARISRPNNHPGLDLLDAWNEGHPAVSVTVPRFFVVAVWLWNCQTWLWDSWSWRISCLSLTNTPAGFFEILGELEPFNKCWTIYFWICTMDIINERVLSILAIDFILPAINYCHDGILHDGHMAMMVWSMMASYWPSTMNIKHLPQYNPYLPSSFTSFIHGQWVS